MKIKLDEGAYLPTRAFQTDAGLDLRTPIDFTIYGGESFTIDTGVHIELPENTFGKITSKSGLMVKSDIITDGTIDYGYSGSICVKLFNVGGKRKSFKAGDKIAQLIVIPCYFVTTELVEDIQGGDRGDHGFGSTGR